MPRPKIEWTPSRQRKLVRLYLCTNMALEEICKALQEENFNPMRRTTQKLLAQLLQPRPDELRPSDRTDMKKRMGAMRQCRAVRSRQTSLEDAGNCDDQPPPSTRSNTVSAGIVAANMNDAFAPLLPFQRLNAINEPLTSSTALSSEFQNSPRPTSWTYTSSWGAPSSGLMSDGSEEDWIRPVLTSQSPRQSPMISQVLANESDPELQATPSRRAVMDLAPMKTILRSLSTKRTSSFIGDCVSLMYRFSFASSNRSSVKSSFNRFRTGRSSAASSETTPSIWYDHNSGIPIPGHHLAVSSNDDPQNQPINDATKGPSRSRHQDVLSSDLILEFCCRESHDCIHRFVSNVASFSPANDSPPSDLTGYDVNRSDTFRNRPLHVAAKWGTTFSTFYSLIQAGADIRALNVAGQTFMHLLDPRNLLKEGKYLYFLCGLLKKCNFPFEARDECGKTFLHKLLEGTILLDKGLIDQILELIVNDENLWVLIHARDHLGNSVATTLYRRALEGARVLEHVYWEWDQYYLRLLERYCVSMPITKCAELLEPGAYFPGGSYFVFYEHLFRPPDQTQLQDCSMIPNTLHKLARAASWPKLPPCPSHLNESAYVSSEQDKAFTERHQRLDFILESGIDINGYDGKLQTPIMAFITSFRQRELDPQTGTFVEHLINKGADIHRRDRHGKTALHLAVECGRKSATEILLRKGANAHARADNGRSVLEAGYRRLRRAKGNEPLYAKIVACLTMMGLHGAVAVPNLWQEWGVTEPEISLDCAVSMIN